VLVLFKLKHISFFIFLGILDYLIGRLTKVKLFLDTANVDEIREAAQWGVISGVTTNPTLIAKEGRNFFEVVNIIEQYGSELDRKSTRLNSSH